MRTLSTLPALALAFVLVTLAPPVSAQGDADRNRDRASDDADRGRVVRHLSITVFDRDGREIAIISPDQPVLLPRDEPVQVRMYEIVGNDRRSVATEFRVARGSEMLEARDNKRSRGEVMVSLRPGAYPTGPLYLGYSINDDVRLADERMRHGQVRVEIAGGLGQMEVDRLVGAVYRGILLREPDQQGAHAARQAILQEGWSGLVRFAQNIANSRESEMDVYAKGACNQQRLIAMYRELLGRDLQRVDQRTWRAQLEQMERGDIDGVVMALMESAEFQDRFGLRTAFRR